MSNQQHVEKTKAKIWFNEFVTRGELEILLNEVMEKTRSC